VPSIEVVPPVKVVLTPVEVQTFDVTVSAPNPVVQVVSEGPQGPSGDAATVDVGTVTVVNPDLPPDVVNSGTTADAVLDFDLPRAAAVSVGTTTTVGPADPAAVTDSGIDGDVVLDFDIPQGVQGDQGVEISAVEPENLTVLWADTSEQGDAVLPLGGSAGQSLVKVSGDDYDTTWADLDTDDVGEGTVNLYNRVPTGGSAGEVLVKQSATDYDLGYGVRHASWTPVSGATYRQTFTLNAAATLDRVLYTALLLPSTTSLSNIVAQVQVEGAAGSVVRLGIYLPDAAGEPGALLVDAGTASATTTGLKSISISETVSGMIYVAVVVQGAVATMAGYRITGASYFTPAAGSSPFTNALFYIESGVSGALPATANATLSGGTQNGYCAGVVVA
jgi:hypothetical protein